MNKQFLHHFNTCWTLCSEIHVSHHTFGYCLVQVNPPPPLWKCKRHRAIHIFHYAQNVLFILTHLQKFSASDAWSSVPYVSPNPAASYLNFLFSSDFLPTEPKMYFPFYMGNLSVGRFFFFFWKRNYTASETYQLSWRRGRTLLKHWIETLKLWHSIKKLLPLKAVNVAVCN